MRWRTSSRSRRTGRPGERLSTRTSHKTLATLRRDGSPRISGTEPIWGDDGELYTGSMWKARRRWTCAATRASPCTPVRTSRTLARRREAGRPRREIHDDDAKHAVVEGEAARPVHLFRPDLDEVVVVQPQRRADEAADRAWHPGRRRAAPQREADGRREPAPAPARGRRTAVQRHRPGVVEALAEVAAEVAQRVGGRASSMPSATTRSPRFARGRRSSARSRRPRRPCEATNEWSIFSVSSGSCCR